MSLFAILWTKFLRSLLPAVTLSRQAIGFWVQWRLDQREGRLLSRLLPLEKALEEFPVSPKRKSRCKSPLHPYTPGQRALICILGLGLSLTQQLGFAVSAKDLLETDSDTLNEGSEKVYSSDAPSLSQSNPTEKSTIESLDADTDFYDGSYGVRRNSANAWYIGAGPRNAWQSYQVGFAWLSEEGMDFIVDGGTGRWSLVKTDVQKNYQFDADTYSLAATLRSYVMGDSGIFLAAGLAYLEFSGKISPQGASEDQSAQSFSTSFNVSALGFFTYIGWQCQFDNRWFVDWHILGMQKNVILSQSFGSASAELKGAMREELQEAKVWGILNIAVGRYF